MPAAKAVTAFALATRRLPHDPLGLGDRVALFLGGQPVLPSQHPHRGDEVEPIAPAPVVVAPAFQPERGGPPFAVLPRVCDRPDGPELDRGLGLLNGTRKTRITAVPA